MKNLVIVLSLFIQFPLIAQIDSTVLFYGNTITAEDLSKHLHVLASDQYEGRETGKRGQKMAAYYMGTFFKDNNIPGGMDGDYYQSFKLLEQHPDGIDIEINDTTFKFKQDFYFFKGFKDSTFTAKNVYFLGYGIDHERYSDVSNLDVQGKVVMVLDGEPTKKNGKSYLTKKKNPSAWTTNYRYKRNLAQKLKVAALLVVKPDVPADVVQFEHKIESTSMDLLLNKDKPTKRRPVFYISESMANALFKSTSTLTELKNAINKNGKPIKKELETDITFKMNRTIDTLTSENVLAYIEGTDKKDELVVVTAHYDHLGKSKDGVVYNGADDDGSGTVALLEIAQAFQLAKDAGDGPRRSILIMPVSGEEKGLLGSEYYAENPVYPLEKTVANLNVDMIGREDNKHKGNPNYVYIIGSTMLSNDLHLINEKANKSFCNLELDYTYNTIDDPNKYYYRSDHYNFAKNNIPVIFYFNGVHEDYHKATDTIDKINFNKIENITKLIFYTAWEVANREERLQLNDDVK